MSAESWVFLFAAMGAVGAVAQVIQLYLQWKGQVNTSQVVAQPDTTAARSDMLVSKRSIISISGFVIFSLFCSIYGFYMASSPAGKNTPESIGLLIEKWGEALGYQVYPESVGGAAFSYAFAVTGIPVHLTRLKTDKKYVGCWAKLDIGEPHILELKKLTPQELEEFRREIEIEMARARIEIVIAYETETKLIRSITVESHMPIPDAEEYIMNDHLRYVAGGFSLAKNTFLREFSRRPKKTAEDVSRKPL